MIAKRHLIAATLTGVLMIAAFRAEAGENTKAASTPAGEQVTTHLQSELYTILQASTAGNLDLVASLLKKNPALLNAHDNMGDTPLKRSIGGLFPNLALIRFLLDQGAEVNQSGFWGTALHTAAAKGNKPVVAVLLDHGADPNLRDHYGRTPLDQTLFFKHLDVARLLMARGAQPNAFDATVLGDSQLLARILDREPWQIHTMEAAASLIEWAFLRCQRSTARVLLAHGADPRAKSITGKSLADLAEQSGCPAMDDLLRSNE